MRNSPNIIITGTPGVGKTVHCEYLAQESDLRHLSINQIAKHHACIEGYDQERKSYIVNEDKLLDTIESDMLKGGNIVDWHACGLFPESWIDLIIVLQCPSTNILYDRLAVRGYDDKKLQENLDSEIFGILLEEARECFDSERVINLKSENDQDLESNCARIITWIQSFKDRLSDEA